LEYRIKIPDWLDGPFVRLALLYRRLRYGYPFRRIPLTQRKYAIVDPDDYERLNRYRWCALRRKNGYYAGRTASVHSRDRGRYILMHRAIIDPPYPLVVDHINRNGLDNRKANLRAVTQAQNVLNGVRKKRANSHSRYRGVSRHIRRKKWAVQISYNGKHKTVGYFENEIDAAKAYDEAAKKYHKEFAVLNFPSES
jgi:hypothetical protein